MSEPERHEASEHGWSPESMLREVKEGLSRPQKVLSSKYFYDERGSRLFEEITRLEEYYPTRSEIVLLERHADEWMERYGPRALVELGAGSARKTRILLDALVERSAGRPAGGDFAPTFIPVDVSGSFLRETARTLRADYPKLKVRPHVADITARLGLAGTVPRPALFMLLGGTIGNFDLDEAGELLGRVRAEMRPEDSFLLGVDLRPNEAKSVARLEEAYDDAQGVTAAFNRNILRVLNRELGTDFDPEAFAHRAHYARDNGRIEMHLVARTPVEVYFPDGTEIRIAEGESVRTEISCKYDRPAVADLFRRAGLDLVEWTTDPTGFYSMAVGSPGVAEGAPG